MVPSRLPAVVVTVTVSEAGEVPATNVRATVMEHTVGAANASRQKMVPRVMATPVLGRVTVRGDAATGPRNLVSATPVAALYAKAEVADTLKAIVLAPYGTLNVWLFAGGVSTAPCVAESNVRDAGA